MLGSISKKLKKSPGVNLLLTPGCYDEITETKQEENQMSPNQKISLRLATLVAQGKTPAEAIDLVLGAGTFKEIADDFWTANQK
jgi:hypothetical protein